MTGLDGTILDRHEAAWRATRPEKFPYNGGTASDCAG